MSGGPLAHSAREPGGPTQSYAEHTREVLASASARAEAMLRYCADLDLAGRLRGAIADAAEFHDFGKLDPQTQTELRRGRGARLTWDHIDAGVAHLSAAQARMAAWLVRAHHAPGLPAQAVHFTPPNGNKLRGRRRDGDPRGHADQIARTDARLDEMRAAHVAALGARDLQPCKAEHGLAMRFALSCLVDADHSDMARFDAGWTPPQTYAPRWAERLAALDDHVAKLGGADDARSILRRAFYDACRDREPDAALIGCEGPVGIGKTTAVTAHLLRRAQATCARRLFIVAPYTAILSQTAETLRKALLSPGEDEDLIAEHHHRADFSAPGARDLATLWTAPMVLTTAVQFFETISSNEPARLRKLHMLPGSVVFLDEAHAALPATGERRRADGGKRASTAFYPQYWRWIEALARDWGCSFVFASGSLARVWECADVIGATPRRLPDLTPATLAPQLRRAETRRVSYRTLGPLCGPAALAAALRSCHGPRLLIMNTVQSAAVMARRLRSEGDDVLHLSTALAPDDRTAILAQIRARLADNSRNPDWTLVATSLMEAGVDVSFRTAFRERFSTAALIQIGGRANRHGEYLDGAEVLDFVVAAGEGLTSHPEAGAAADVLAGLFEAGALDGEVDCADLVTTALRRQTRIRGVAQDLIGEGETRRAYPDVTSLARLIDADTRFVVVRPELRDRLERREPIASRELLGASVQLWAKNVDRFALEPIRGREQLFFWPYAYDPAFLGYMEGALPLLDVEKGGAFIL